MSESEGKLLVFSPEAAPPRKPPRLAKKTKSWTQRVKAWAWRFTALLVVLNVVFSWIGWTGLEGLEERITYHVVDFLSSVGFAPVNVSYLPKVVKWVWFLLITGFSPLKLLGLFFYVLCSPMTLLLYATFYKVIKITQASQPKVEVPGLRRKARNWRLVPLVVVLLLGWFILYGGSISRRPLLVGLVLAALLFMVLVYSAFQRAGPADDTAASGWEEFGIKGLAFATNITKGILEKPPKTKLEAATSLRMALLYEKPFRFFTLFFRGRDGRDRVAVIILAEYVVFLFFLAISAILFWAFVILALVPSPSPSLAAALHVSASHFLPGLSQSTLVPLPWWAEFGPGITSWILFVVYVGPAASALQKQQQQFIEDIAPSYRLYRKTTLLYGAYRRRLQKIIEQLN